jgi:hypothetical protein
MAAAARSSRPIGAIAVTLAGVVLIVVGIAGAAGHWGRTTKTESVVPVAQRTPTTKAVTTSQGATAFVAQLDTALASGDTNFTLAHLHPAVIDRYGVDECRAYVATLKDPSKHFAVHGNVTPPQDYTYASDGKSTVVPGVVGVTASVVTPASTTPTVVHTVVVDGLYRWFTDCGAPVG